MKVNTGMIGATVLRTAFGGIALLLGIYPRIVALGLIPTLLGAIATVHAGAGFFFNNGNGGWEFPAFWALALNVQALIGDGLYALEPTSLPGTVTNSAIT